MKIVGGGDSEEDEGEEDRGRRTQWDVWVEQGRRHTMRGETPITGDTRPDQAPLDHP